MQYKSVIMYFQQHFCMLCRKGLPASSRILTTAYQNTEHLVQARHFSQHSRTNFNIKVSPEKHNKLDTFVNNLRTHKGSSDRKKWKQNSKQKKSFEVSKTKKLEDIFVSPENAACVKDRMEHSDVYNPRYANIIDKDKEDKEVQMKIGTTDNKLPVINEIENKNSKIEGVKSLYIEVPGRRHFKVNKTEESFIFEMMNLDEMKKALSAVEEHARNQHYVSFVILNRLCAWASIEGQVDDVMRIKEMAENAHPKQYRRYMFFDYYLASALHLEGRLQETFDILFRLFVQNPNRVKKVKDTAALVVLKAVNSCEESKEELALQFVTTLAKEHNQFGPALAYWRACFCSILHRHHVMASELIEQIPELTEHLPRKIDAVIDLASSSGDKELLNRTLQLLLQYDISEYYAAVTSALIKYHCDVGDLSGADETLKFAMNMKIQLNHNELQRFLSLLNHHKRPAPLTVLTLKYGRAPVKPLTLPKAPKFEYKF